MDGDNLVSGILLEDRERSAGKTCIPQNMEKMNEQNVFIAPYKKAVKVAISKALMTILNIFGFGAYFSALYLAWVNVDVFTRTILQLLGAVFALFKIIQAIDTWWHKRQLTKEEIMKTRIERKRNELEQTIREESYIRDHTKFK